MLKSRRSPCALELHPQPEIGSGSVLAVGNQEAPEQEPERNAQRQTDDDSQRCHAAPPFSGGSGAWSTKASPTLLPLMERDYFPRLQRRGNSGRCKGQAERAHTSKGGEFER